ncbi:MAG: hypothetical protein BJ554DRAFT_1476 [Olpidium bornovanus]|uniref:Uncharacterized protein n=1 Tax=Olpidium bornovanus TaxID=278681 RepID=A0A8H8DHE5_9FUNG|nr:MAG: hypothetical protein BJ554DRAFT_1476 [Olpidium bornovanus]
MRDGERAARGISWQTPTFRACEKPPRARQKKPPFPPYPHHIIRAGSRFVAGVTISVFWLRGGVSYPPSLSAYDGRNGYYSTPAPAASVSILIPGPG